MTVLGFRSKRGSLRTIDPIGKPTCHHNSIGNSPSAVGSSQMRDVSQTCSKKTPASGCGSCMRGITLCLPNGLPITRKGLPEEAYRKERYQGKEAATSRFPGTFQKAQTFQGPLSPFIGLLGGSSFALTWLK